MSVPRKTHMRLIAIEEDGTTTVVEGGYASLERTGVFNDRDWPIYGNDPDLLRPDRVIIEGDWKATRYAPGVYRLVTFDPGDHWPQASSYPDDSSRLDCSCGWNRDDSKLDWSDHIRAAEDPAGWTLAGPPGRARARKRTNPS